jgi:hypothetical protein
MVTNSITQQRDDDAVRALISYWLHHVSDTLPAGWPDDPYCVAGVCVSESLGNAADANAPVECVFGAGVELGIKLALAVADNPFGKSEVVSRIETGLQNAKHELEELSETARRDSTLTASAA